MLSTLASHPTISANANNGFYAGMDVREIRRENLAELVRAHRGNKALADAIDTDPAYISQLLSTKTKADMGHSLARRIEQALDLPGGWMDQGHANEPMIAEGGAPKYADPRARLYPLIPWSQTTVAGRLAENLTASIAEDWLPCPARCGPRTYVLRVQGHSMLPRFAHGDLIFVDPDAEPHHESFVVARLESAQQAIFRQLVIEGTRRFLFPLNERWPDPVVEIDNNATLCGVVVFQGRPV